MSGSLSCPSCGHVNDAATGLGTEFEPSAGAASICISCAAIGVFTGDGVNTRRPSDDERRQIEADPQVRRAVAVVKQYNRARAARWN